MPHTTTQHQTLIQLAKAGHHPTARRCGTILGGPAGLLVGPAGMGSGAGIAGGGTTVGAPRGRQQQPHPLGPPNEERVQMVL